jgi:hypothetical protein
MDELNLFAEFGSDSLILYLYDMELIAVECRTVCLQLFAAKRCDSKVLLCTYYSNNSV